MKRMSVTIYENLHGFTVNCEDISFTSVIIVVMWSRLVTLQSLPQLR